VWNTGGTILTEKTEALSKKLSQCHFLHYGCHVDWRGTEPKPLRREADDQLPEPWHVFLLYVYVYSSCHLALLGYPDLRFFHAFSSVVRQIPGYNPQRQGTAHTLPKFLCCLIYCLFCVPCIVFVYMCTVLLPLGVNPIAVNKYIISCHSLVMLFVS
jgi:hypothetical protein